MHLHCQQFQTDELLADGLVHLAFLSLKQNDLSRAMSLLTSLCGADRTNYFSELEVDFGRVVCLAALQLAEPARELLEQTLPKRRRIDEHDRKLPYEWLECRISVHLGDLDHAIPRLEAIRRWLVERYKLAPIALCSIDLALAYVKQGNAAQRLSGLLRDLANKSGAAENPWALGALRWFCEALEHGEEPALAARKAAEMIHRREKSIERLALSQ